MKINFFVVLAICVFVAVAFACVATVLMLTGYVDAAAVLFVVGGLSFAVAVVSVIAKYVDYKRKSR